MPRHAATLSGASSASGASKIAATVVVGPVIDRTLCTTGFQEIVVDRARQPSLSGSRAAALLGEAEDRARSERRRMPVPVVPDARVVLRVPSHRPLRTRQGQNRRRSRRDALRVPSLLAHNKGWEITRNGLGEFVLHPPPGWANRWSCTPRCRSWLEESPESPGMGAVGQARPVRLKCRSSSCCTPMRSFNILVWPDVLPADRTRMPAHATPLESRPGSSSSTPCSSGTPALNILVWPTLLPSRRQGSPRTDAAGKPTRFSSSTRCSSG